MISPFGEILQEGWGVIVGGCFVVVFLECSLIHMCGRMLQSLGAGIYILYYNF